MVNDPYQVLGVSRNASKEEIKKAYRQKARQYHPDTHPNDPNATRKMNEINEAYDMLNHPEKYASQQSQSSGSGSYGYGNNNSGYGNGYGGYGSSSNGYGGYGTGYDSNGYRNKGYGDQNSQNGYGGYSQNGQYGWYGNFNDFFGGYSGYSGGQVNVNPSAVAGDSQEIRAAINYINSGQYDAAIQILTRITSAGRNARWYYLCSLAFYGKRDMTHATDYMQKAVQMDPNNTEYQQLLSYFINDSRTQSYTDSETTTTYKATGCSGPILKRLIIPIIIILVIYVLIGGSWCYGCYGCTGTGCMNQYSDVNSSSSGSGNSSNGNSGYDDYYNYFYGGR